MKMIKVPGRYENLVELSEYIRQAAQEAGLDDFAVYSVETAVEEACTNIIEHAYGGEGKGEIQCKCQVSDEGLTIYLHDQGKPFDPKSIEEPDIHAPLKKRKSNGLGLYIMRQWMDDVKFDFDARHGNTLTMVKRKEKKP